MSLSIGPGINIAGSVNITPAIGTTIPDNPIIGTAFSNTPTAATVTYTAPTENGGSTILKYIATSTPDGVTGTLNQAGSGTITVDGLTPSTSYTFRVTATNSIGISSPSLPSNSITTAGAGPLNTVAPVVTGTATVGQTLSTTNGTWTGTPTIVFTYQWQRNEVNISSATSSTYILVDADAENPIRCVVTGTNSAGTNLANSNATSNVSAIAPGAPTIGTATAITTSATVTFTAPVNNGGSTILSYTATSSPGGLTGTVTQAGSGTITVSGLTIGTSYTFTVTATNIIGTGSSSSASNSITAYSAPFNTVAPVVSGTATVGQTLSIANGTWLGTEIIQYSYTWQRNGINIGGSAYFSTYTLVAADAGNSIRCVVGAANTYGSSSANSNSTSNVAAIVPNAPIIGTATPTSLTSISVAFTAPASNGGSTIQSYTATSSPGGITGTLNQAGSGTIIVTGLTTGTSYTFTVTATNSVGTSSPSSVSNSIATYTVPVNTVAPVVSGTERYESVLSCTTGTWTGTPTPTYTYQWQRNGVNISLATNNTYTLTSFDVFTVINCVVTGTNQFGTASASSNSTLDILPIAPGAPTSIIAFTNGSTGAYVEYTAPINNGGAAITSYTATSSPGNITGTVSQSGSGTIIITGLTPATSYTFTVTATNGYGTSSPSTASNSITTNNGVPNAPTIGTATATGDITANVAYTAPAFNGGATIIRYTATSNPGNITGTLTQAGSGTISVTRLVPSTSYTFTVTATNSVGTGSPSAASNSITTNAPPAGAKRAIFGFGNTSTTTYVSMVNLVSYYGIVASDVTNLYGGRATLAAAGYGGDKALFGFGVTGAGASNVTNLVSNTGVLASDSGGVGTIRARLAASGYGGDKAIFGFGLNNSGVYVSTTNLVSNTGVVAANQTVTTGRSRGYLAGATYGSSGRAIFGYGQVSTNVSTTVTNQVSNTGAVANDVTGVGTARWGLAAAGYGGDKAIFGFGYNGTQRYGVTNLVSNTGVVATDTAFVGTPRYYLAAAGYGGNKAIFGYGMAVGQYTTITNLVSNTGVVASDVSGIGTARNNLAAASYSSTV
jgi:hypothetical protein